ncbi:DUF2817 domain-containing protein [SAR92 clade bacterium H246]
MSSNSYRVNPFSESILQANRHIQQCALEIGAKYEYFPHEMLDPMGQSLGTSVIWVGPREAKKVLMIVSGTHGAEGWAGAAIQLDTLTSGLLDKRPPDTAVMLIHLINPWGCAWGRRENEDNADLFRDFIYYKPEIYSDDSQFDDALADALTLKSYDEATCRQSAAALDKISLRHTDLELTQILRAGQFRYPQAPCYNGGGISWSFHLYKDLVKRYLSQAKQVFLIDIHTAFGEYGDGILIPYYQPDGPDKAKFQYLEQTYGSEKLFVGGFDPTIPSHPRMPYEIATDFIPGLDMIATGLEFGTYDWPDPINLGKYMNYLFVFGDPVNPERPDLVEQYKKCCYPDTDDWREMVITRGREVVEQTLAGMDSYPSPSEQSGQKTP